MQTTEGESCPSFTSHISFYINKALFLNNWTYFQVPSYIFTSHTAFYEHPITVIKFYISAGSITVFRRPKFTRNSTEFDLSEFQIIVIYRLLFQNICFYATNMLKYAHIVGQVNIILMRDITYDISNLSLVSNY